MLKIVETEVSIEERINSLADSVLQLQSEEREIKRKIDEQKAALIELCGIKEEGSQSFHTDAYKVTTQQSIVRTVDASVVRALRDRVPEATYENVFVWKPSLDLKNYKALKEMAPNLAAVVDEAITSKPAKAGVKLEVKGE